MKLSTVARIPMVLIVAVVGGCSMAPAAQQTARPQPTITFLPTATAPPTATPSPPIQPTPVATPDAPDTPSPTKKPPNRFPKGTLRAGDVVAEGSRGTYCYKDTCADLGQWPRKADLPELVVGAADAELEFSLPESARFVTWDVAYAAASSYEDESTELARGGYPYDADANPEASVTELSRVSFAAPPSGDWVVWVWVTLRFGDLSYAWHVIVP
jgi:hypothetical protein